MEQAKVHSPSLPSSSCSLGCLNFLLLPPLHLLLIPLFPSQISKLPPMVKSTLLLFFLLVVLRTNAEISNIKISADSRPLILFERFGFSSNGSVSISLSETTFVSSSVTRLDPSLIGFFLLPQSNFLQTLISQKNPQNPNSCILSSPYVQLLLTLHDVINSFNGTFPVLFPDEYSLFLANCAPETSLSMSIRTELYNSGPGGSPDYLPVGESPVPAIYTLASLVYLSFLALWLHVIKSQKPAHRIHHFMAGLLLAKALNLIFAAEDRHHVRTTGTTHGWGPLSCLFQLIRGVLSFTVIFLIGAGWSFLKPFLQDREKRVLMLVVPIQVVTNVALAVIGETGPSVQDRVASRQVLLLIDFVCCGVVLFPVMWSIRSLRETSKNDGKAARNLAKLLMFRKFYVAVVGYMYFTRVVMLAIGAIASYEYRWVSVATDETVGLAFYAFLFYMFRPKERNAYFVSDDVEEAAAKVALMEGGFLL